MGSNEVLRLLVEAGADPFAMCASALPALLELLSPRRRTALVAAPSPAECRPHPASWDIITRRGSQSCGAYGSACHPAGVR